MDTTNNENPSMADENVETTLPKFEVGTGNPDMPDGKEITFEKDQATGTLEALPEDPTEDADTEAVPGTPNYGPNEGPHGRDF